MLCLLCVARSPPPTSRGYTLHRGKCLRGLGHPAAVSPLPAFRRFLSVPCAIASAPGYHVASAILVAPTGPVPGRAQDSCSVSHSAPARPVELHHVWEPRRGSFPPSAAALRPQPPSEGPGERSKLRVRRNVVRRLFKPERKTIMATNDFVPRGTGTLPVD